MINYSSVRRAERFGFAGEAAIEFAKLGKDAQDAVLMAKWRLASVDPEDVADLVELDMTPVQYFSSSHFRDS